MASVRPTPTGRYELTIRNKLLPRRVYLTFNTEAKATQYGEQVERLLAQGIVPRGLVPEEPAVRRTERVAAVLRSWLATGQPAPSDTEVLRLLIAGVGDLDMTGLTYAWAEGWVAGMKRSANLAPGTIRKRVGSLLFTFWSGEPADLKKTTARLSSRFSNLLAYAGHPELTEHDLRHEATCQWFELRDSAGQWVFRNEEIDRIMGWAPGSEMSKRYASFRAEDLAARLWS